jgi:hypothetical protein
MSSLKTRAIWTAIGALFILAIVLTVVALGGGATAHHAARNPVPAAVAPAGKANAPAPAPQPTRTQTETAPHVTTAKKPPAGTPQSNGGDSDPDNNGGPDDSDGAV